MKEKEKGITKNKPHIVKEAVEIPNLNITYQKKRKTKKKTAKTYKIYYYNDDDDDFNDVIDSASESNEESSNFDDDDNDNVNYKKNLTRQIKNKKRKELITI